jgi:hypothetical protein
MPVKLTLTEGVLPKGTEQQAAARITQSFLKHHGLAGNKVMTPNVTAQIHVLPKDRTLSGGQPFSGAWVEWILPSFAMTDRKVQQDFAAEATAIIHELSGNKQPKDHIYVNVLHAVDGIWNFNGRAMTNAEILETVSRG